MQETELANDYYDTPPRNGLMTVTPELADAWLKRRNKGNRRISWDVVKQYTETMRENRWQITHQGIAFDEDGNLLDGQHRLKACVDAKVPFKVMVMVNVPRHTFAVVDTGRRRQANQLLDVRHSTVVAAAARIISSITGRVETGTSLIGHVVPNKVDNDVILSVVEDWPELVLWAPRVSGAYGAVRILQSAHLAIVAQAARKPHSHLLDSWFEGITYGAGLEIDDPRLVLRNRFFQGVDVKGSGSVRIARSYLLIVKAWNAYAAGRPIRMLKVTPDQVPPAVL